MSKENKKLEQMIVCYRETLDKIATGVVIVDEEGIIIEYNRAAEELEEIKRADAIGKSPSEIYYPENPNIESRLLNALHTGKPLCWDYEKYLNSDGKHIRVVQSYFPIFDDGKIIGSCSILNEVQQLEKVISEIKAIKKKALSASFSNTEMTFEDIIGDSLAMRKTIGEARSVSTTDADVLIIGETGTGKELVVNAIHHYSRKGEPFVPINCATIPENLLESILFGTKKGAFTGSENTVGLFESARGGTIFLDELNSMNTECQSKLLRAIQEKKIRKVGDDKEIPIKCRIIAALNVDPMECVRKGLLREDLFYRLSIACISIPPLRKRKKDIDILVKYFIKKFNEKYDRNIKGITEELGHVFYNHQWKGNVRELQNVVEGMFIMSKDDEVLGIRNLSEFQLKIFGIRVHKTETITLTDRLFQFEKQLIEDALMKTGGNKRAAATMLGITAQNLNYKIKKFGL